MACACSMHVAYPKASDIVPLFRSWSPQAETKILEVKKQLADSQLEVQEAAASATAEADAKAKVTCI